MRGTGWGGLSAAVALASVAVAAMAQQPRPAPKVAAGVQAKAPTRPAPQPPAKAPARPAAKPAARAAPVPAIPATGDLQDSDLLAIARKRMTNMRTDAFTGEVTKQYDGRHFVVRQRVASKINADWSYSIDSQGLSMQTDDLHEIALFYKSTPRGSFIGQTAMGVKFRIEKSDEISVVLTVSNGWDIRDVRYQATLAPDEARRLAANAVLVLEGDLVASEGVLTDCGFEELNASLDDPTLVNRFECRIRAKLTRVALEDPAGAVLASWPRVAAPRGGVTRWLRQPTPEDVARYYPDRAQRLEISGTASLKCSVDQRGVLNACTVVKETPDSAGFGDSALKLSKLYKAAPGGPEEVEVTIDFKRPG